MPKLRSLFLHSISLDFIPSLSSSHYSYANLASIAFQTSTHIDILASTQASECSDVRLQITTHRQSSNTSTPEINNQNLNTSTYLSRDLTPFSPHHPSNKPVSCGSLVSIALLITSLSARVPISYTTQSIHRPTKEKKSSIGSPFASYTSTLQKTKKKKPKKQNRNVRNGEMEMRHLKHGIFTLHRCFFSTPLAPPPNET